MCKDAVLTPIALRADEAIWPAKARERLAEPFLGSIEGRVPRDPPGIACDYMPWPSP
jgi:hypothetical protein